MKDLQTKKKQNSKNKDEISDIEHDNEDMLTLGSVSFKKSLNFKQNNARSALFKLVIFLFIVFES
jgi:hypothetical protein